MNALASIFNLGRGDYDPQDDELGMPDKSETTDLDRHVTRCALRYRELRKSQNGSENRLRRIEIAGLILVVVLIAYNPLVHDFVKHFLGF